jgi:hypothetical protein
MSQRSPSSVRLVGGLLLTLLLLSLADLFLTWRLIQGSDGQVLESNPLANWWLANYGWGGMAAFKLAMFLIIGGLAGLIAWRRPQTGERILVFSCGAQSAVVLYSVLLSGLVEGPPGQDPDGSWVAALNFRSAGRPRFLAENSLLRLLHDEAIQKELQLSEAQRSTLDQLAAARQAVRQGAERFGADEWAARVQELLAQEKEVVDNLEPAQSRRLQQIAWQQRGPMVFIDPDMIDALQLSPEQRERMWLILQEAEKARNGPPRFRGFGPDPARRAEEAANRTRARMLAVLTPEQAARWKEMIGEPFKGAAAPRPGTPR